MCLWILFSILFDGFCGIHRLKTIGLWKRLLCMSVSLKWKLVLKSNHTLMKPSMHVKLLLVMHVSQGFRLHVRIWAIDLFVSFSSLSMMSAQWSSSLSVAYLFIQEIFKDLKKFQSSIKFSSPSDLGPHRIS